MGLACSALSAAMRDACGAGEGIARTEALCPNAALARLRVRPGCVRRMHGSPVSAPQLGQATFNASGGRGLVRASGLVLALGLAAGFVTRGLILVFLFFMGALHTGFARPPR